MSMKRGLKTVPARRTRAVPRRVTRRRSMPGGDFVFPSERAFPIHDAYHATLALSSLMRVAGRHGVDRESRERARRVVEVVCERYPSVCEGEADLVAEVERTYGIRGGSPSRSSRLDELLRKYSR